MVEPSVTQLLLDAFAGVCDKREQVQWLSSLRLTDFLLRGGTIPDDHLDNVVASLCRIAQSDTDSETHLFSCMSLMLLGHSDVEPRLRYYLGHESDTFRASAAHILSLDRD